MSDETLPVALLIVGIFCIIVMAICIVWAIVQCEKHRKATYPFKQVKRSPRPLPISERAIKYSPVKFDSSNSEIPSNFMDIPIQQQVAAILGSFPDITDYQNYQNDDIVPAPEPHNHVEENSTTGNESATHPIKVIIIPPAENENDSINSVNNNNTHADTLNKLDASTSADAAIKEETLQILETSV